MHTAFQISESSAYALPPLITKNLASARSELLNNYKSTVRLVASISFPFKNNAFDSVHDAVLALLHYLSTTVVLDSTFAYAGSCEFKGLSSASYRPFVSLKPTLDSALDADLFGPQDDSEDV